MFPANNPPYSSTDTRVVDSGTAQSLYYPVVSPETNPSNTNHQTTNILHSCNEVFIVCDVGDCHAIVQLCDDKKLFLHIRYLSFLLS